MMNSVHNRFTALFLAICVLFFFPSEVAIGQADNEIAPVKESDQIEVKYGSTWYPGTVLDYANNFANVNYKWRSTMFDGKFAVENMRFPNGEGPWQEWTDASKSFSVIARYITRDPTHVTLRKQDNADVKNESGFGFTVDQADSVSRAIPVSGPDHGLINGSRSVRLEANTLVPLPRQRWAGLVPRERIDAAWKLGNPTRKRGKCV